MTHEKAKSNLTAAQKLAAQAQEASAAANGVVAKAQATLDAARGEVARAERAFETDDKGWPAVEAARRASAQSELRLDQAIARAEAAATKSAEAQAAVLFAQSAVDAAEQAERRKRIAELTVACGDLLLQMQTNLQEMEKELGQGLPNLDYPALRMVFFDHMRVSLQRVDANIRDGRSVAGWLRG